jgi:methyltransferase
MLNKTTTVKTNEEAINILHKNGVKVAGQFIIYPEYTKEDFEQLAEYVEKMNLVHPIFSVLTPLPETDLYYRKKEELLTENYEMYDLVHCVLSTKLPREEFYKCYADLLLRCYSNHKDSASGVIPEKILQQLYSQIVNGYKLLH